MNEEKQIEIPCFLTVLLSILIDKLSINYIKAETHQTKLNSSICALFETIPQREFIETGYDPTASNRSRICSTTSNDNNIIQSDAKIDLEKTSSATVTPGAKVSGTEIPNQRAIRNPAKPLLKSMSRMVISIKVLAKIYFTIIDKFEFILDIFYGQNLSFLIGSLNSKKSINLKQLNYK